MGLPNYIILLSGVPAKLFIENFELSIRKGHKKVRKHDNNLIKSSDKKVEIRLYEKYNSTNIKKMIPDNSVNKKIDFVIPDNCKIYL